MKHFGFLIFCPLFLLLPSCLLAFPPTAPLILWYEHPAQKWVEAIPVGNGRLGGMVFGGISNEHLQFNEDTLWTGQPHEYQHEGASKHLPQIRQLLFDGKQKEAEDLAMRIYFFPTTPMLITTDVNWIWTEP